MKKVIDIQLLGWCEFDCEGTAEEIIQRLQKLQNEAQARGAECYINKETEYGRYGEDDRTILVIYDRRLETDEEYQQRLNEQEEAKNKSLQYKREQLEALKKELGE